MPRPAACSPARRSKFAKRAFALYLANFPTYTMIYGAFAALPVFLLWMYVSWLVVLAGAVFTAMLPGYRVSRSSATGRRGASSPRRSTSSACFRAPRTAATSCRSRASRPRPR